MKYIRIRELLLVGVKDVVISLSVEGVDDVVVGDDVLPLSVTRWITLPPGGGRMWVVCVGDVAGDVRCRNPTVSQGVTARADPG